MEFIREISFTHRYWILFLPLFLMAADVVTGWIQATINETWDSTKMRVGLYRKSGEILLGMPAIPRSTFMRAYAKFKASGEE